LFTKVYIFFSEYADNLVMRLSLRKPHISGLRLRPRRGKHAQQQKKQENLQEVNPTADYWTCSTNRLAVEQVAQKRPAFNAMRFAV
jgi:hypothetical protein